MRLSTLKTLVSVTDKHKFCTIDSASAPNVPSLVVVCYLWVALNIRETNDFVTFFVNSQELKYSFFYSSDKDGAWFYRFGTISSHAVQQLP
jgi:hypothetical protein